MYSSKKCIYLVQDVLQALGKEKVEFILVFFCRNDIPIEYKIINKGSKFKCIFKDQEYNTIRNICKENKYDSIIISHNHPNIFIAKAFHWFFKSILHKEVFNPVSPSPADLNLTHIIMEGLNFFNIKLLDHIIVSNNSAFSFAENGYMGGENGNIR